MPISRTELPWPAATNLPVRRSAACLVLALTLGACAPAVRANPPASPAPPAVTPAVSAAAGKVWVFDRLYLGRNIPDGGTVSEEAWAAFLDEVVTPRFTGLTVLRVNGQWEGVDGEIIREESFILELYYPPSAEAEASVGVVTAEYKRRFAQQAVMRVRTLAEVQFLEEE